MSPLSKPKIIILLVNEKQVCRDWRKVFEICIRSPFVGHKSQKLSSWERCMNCERTKQIIKIKYFNIQGVQYWNVFFWDCFCYETVRYDDLK